jgi:hypothetical protein
MSKREPKTVRQSVSLPPGTAQRVRALAKAERTSASRVLVELVETGLRARDEEKSRFVGLVEQLARSRDPAEQKRIKQELARLTFGE